MRLHTLNLILLAGLSGCAGFTPLVDLSKIDAKGSDASLATAKDYARQVRDAYRAELLTHTRWRGASANGLLAIGSLALGAGLAKSHSSVFNGLAWAGGSGYAASQLNLRPETEAVYAGAVQTLDCALAAVAPLDIGSDSRQSLEAKVQALSGALAAHATALGRFERARSDDAAVQALLTAKAAASRALVAPAQQQLSAATTLLGKVKRAGVELVNAVDGIRSEIDRTLLQTVPDPKAAVAVVGALNGYAQASIGGIRKVDAKQAQSGDDGTKAQSERLHRAAKGQPALRASDGGADPYEALLAAEADLQTTRDALSLALAGLDTDASATAAAACKFAGVLPPLTASRPKLSFTAGRADQQSVVAQGGKPPFSGSLSGGADSGLSLVVPHPFDRRFDVQLSKDAKPARYVLVLRDADPISPREVEVEVEVAAGSEAPPPAEPQSGALGTDAPRAALVAKLQPGASLSLGGHKFQYERSELLNPPAGEGRPGVRLHFRCSAGAGAAAVDPAKLVQAFVKRQGAQTEHQRLIKLPNVVDAQSQPAGCLRAP